jgi:protein involved in polysaccharide export with SLBB domain
MVLLRRSAVLMIVLLCVTACGSLGGSSAPSQGDAAASAQDEYQLGPEDKIKVTVYGEPDLSGEFLVDSSGVLSAPFVGQISVKGLTVRAFEAAYAAKLRDAKILKDPKVSAEVTTFRPIYVLGEVKKPGQYAYVSGMTVQKAVALAEGYTYRANEGSVEITRAGRKFSVDVTPQTKVLPGDEIHIPERYF